MSDLDLVERHFEFLFLNTQNDDMSTTIVDVGAQTVQSGPLMVDVSCQTKTVVWWKNVVVEECEADQSKTIITDDF